jgi:hypothetical protein
MQLITQLLTAMACVASVSACGSRDSSASLSDAGRPFPRPARAAVMVLENRSYEQVIGSPKAPYINQLARRNALATRYYAVTHPSLPNYIALTGGSLFDITRNCSSCDVTAENIVGQLDSAGRSWKAYFEDIDTNGGPGPITKEYNPYYNPFVFYERVRGVASDRDRVVGFDTLQSDLAGGQMADFVWLAPGVRHDGHNSTLHAADNYAARLVPQVLHALGPNGVLYLTWDEGTRKDLRGARRPGGGRVALIAAGGAARVHKRTAVRANHYALLRTLEAGFGLPALKNAGHRSTPLLRGLLRPVSTTGAL